jgi:hypothetical protein
VVVKYENGERHNGVMSESQIQMAARDFSHSIAAGDEAPSAALSNMMKREDISADVKAKLWDGRQISDRRSRLKGMERMNAPGESPEELLKLCDRKIRSRDIPEIQAWVARDKVEVIGETIVPYTNDFHLNQTCLFFARCVSHYGFTKCMWMIGDATHDETRQRLKKLTIGFAGCHFTKSEWSNTECPSIHAMLSQESFKGIMRTLEALAEALLNLHGSTLQDHVRHIVWDGNPEAIAAFKAFFGSDVPITMCLQHAKKLAKKRFTGGHKQLVPKLLEMLAFLPRCSFHVGMEALLKQLRATGTQQVGLKYLMTTGGKGGSLTFVDGLWNAHWRSAWDVTENARSAFLAQSC